MVIINILKNKNLILSFSVAGFLIAFILTLNLGTYEKAKIIIKNPPNNLFSSYDDLIKVNLHNFDSRNSALNSGRYYKKYESILNINLLSKDNLDNFLSKNNYTSKQFSFTPLLNQNEKMIHQIYFGIYNRDVNGLEILTNYINYIKGKTTNELVKILEKDMEQSIALYEKEILIAEKLNIIQPANIGLSPFIPTENNLQFSYQQPIYYMGSLVLNLRLNELKKSLAKLDVKNFDYNIILDNSRYIENEKNYINEKRIAGFLIGFILSLLILYVKFFFLKFKHKLY